MYQTPTRIAVAGGAALASLTADSAPVDEFSGRSWFALVAQPGKQAQARDELAAQGYGAFLPMCIRSRKNGRVVEDIERPLFDRYLFAGVALDEGQAFSPIRNTRGVAMVVQNASKAPLVVQASALRRVKARCDKDGGKVDLRPGGRMLAWGEGTQLRVTEGPMQGLIAAFSGPLGTEAARVVVELFGRPTVATMPIAFLEKAAF